MRKWNDELWNNIQASDLDVERKQCAEEGKDISAYEAEFAALAGIALATEEGQARACALLDATAALPVQADCEWVEPSDLEGIREARPAAQAVAAWSGSGEELLDRELGAWQGRAAGCLLGAAVEGKKRGQIEKYLKSQGRWPLSDYFSSASDPEVAKECGFGHFGRRVFAENIAGMPEDDDMNYTVTGLALLKKHGRDFTPDDVARFWLGNIPLYHVCTAERVAYRNLVAGIAPPDSAIYRNVYREWIGAQIRGDYFGYINPGNPEEAAGMAWRDACISHVKNGIYGEMWAAASIATAFVTDDVATALRGGLAQVPERSRLRAAIERTIGLHASGMGYWEAVEDLHARWNEFSGHDWCHTISNAEIVAIALLWGEKDYERTICYSVMPGFDTDCNGATAGSILGAMLGAKGLPAKWIAPMRDTLETGVAGYHRVSLSAVAKETAEMVGGG